MKEPNLKFFVMSSYSFEKFVSTCSWFGIVFEDIVWTKSITFEILSFDIPSILRAYFAPDSSLNSILILTGFAVFLEGVLKKGSKVIRSKIAS